MINERGRLSCCEMMHKMAGPAAPVVADGTTDHAEEKLNKIACSGKQVLSCMHLAHHDSESINIVSIS